MAASFTDAPVSRADFTSVIDAAEKGGLVERHRGHYQRFDFGNGVVAGAGKVTRFRALPALMSFAAERGLTPENVDGHFTRQATLLQGYANPLKRLDTSESVNLHKCLILLNSCRTHATR